MLFLFIVFAAIAFAAIMFGVFNSSKAGRGKSGNSDGDIINTMAAANGMSHGHDCTEGSRIPDCGGSSYDYDLPIETDSSPGGCDCSSCSSGD